MNALTRLLRAPGVAEITVTPDWTHESPEVDITVLADSYAAGQVLAESLHQVERSQSREPAGDPGEWADFYDWRGWVDGLRVRVTWNERVIEGGAL